MLAKAFTILVTICVVSYTTYASDGDSKDLLNRPKGITLKNLPKFPVVCDLSDFSKYPDSVRNDIIEVVREEVNGMPSHRKKPYLVVGFTLAEAEKYFKPQMVAIFVKYAPHIPAIFSSKHFAIPAQSPQVNILSLSEAEQYALYKADPYLDQVIENCLSYKSIHQFYEQVNIIDPRLLMLGWQTIYNFYQKSHSSTNSVGSAEVQEKLMDLLDFPTDPKQREQFYLNHDFSFLTRSRINNIFGIANRIIEYTAEGDNIIIFGNTPYYIGRALNLIMGQNPDVKRNIIELPFSGAPNNLSRLLRRELDIVTIDRLKHLKSRLQRLGLFNGNDLLKRNTYIIDVIGKGSGIFYLLTTILQELDSQQLPQLPYFEVIALNELSTQEKKNKVIVERNVLDGENVELSLPSITFPYFTIGCTVMRWEDAPEFDLGPEEQPLLRVFPCYNPAYWNEEYDFLLTQDYTPHIQIMFEHFDTNIRHLIERQQ